MFFKTLILCVLILNNFVLIAIEHNLSDELIKIEKNVQNVIETSSGIINVTTNPIQRVLSTNNCSHVSEITDLKVVNISSDSIYIKWRAPEPEKCVESYKITYEIVHVDKSKKITKSFNASVLLNNLEACAIYLIIIQPIIITDRKRSYIAPEKRINVQTNETIPSKVTDLKLKSEQNTIQIHWNEPETGAYCVQHYKILSQSMGLLEKQILVNSSILFYNLIDLNYCSTYQIIVTALTAKFNESEPSESEQSTEFIEPSKVILTAVSNETNIFMSWTKPNHGTECVTNYKIDLNGSDGNIKSDLVPLNQTFYMFNSLNSCVNYSIAVTPIAIKINGSTTIAYIETQSTNVSEVANLRADSITSHSLNVIWEQPDEKYCIVNYNITYVNKQTGEIKSHSVPNEQTSHTITGLEPCIEYNITVIPNVKDNKSSVQRSTDGRTLEENPSKIQNLNATSTGNNIQLQWQKPLQAPFCVTQYEIKYAVIHDSNISTKNTTDLSVILTDLASCFSYSISIVPQTANGTYGNMTSIIYTTNGSVPEKPQCFTTDIGKTWINFNCSITDKDTNNCTLTHAKSTCTAQSPIHDWTKNTSFAELDFSDQKFQISQYFINNTEMSPFTNYNCSMVVINQNGLSDEFIVSNRTKADFPSTPKLVNITTNAHWIYVEWKNSDVIPGNNYSLELNISAIKSNYYIPLNCPAKEPPKPFSKLFTLDVTWYNYSDFIDVAAATQYLVTIRSQTEIGWCIDTDSRSISTKPSISDAVPRANATLTLNHPTESYPYGGNITWETPCDSHGVLDYFQLNVEGTRQGFNSIQFPQTVPAVINQTIYTQIIEIKPKYKYNINITSTVVDGIGASQPYFITFTTKAGIPQYRYDLLQKHFTVDPYKTDNPMQKVQVKFDKRIFTNEMGDIMYYSLIVAQVEFEGTANSGIIQSSNDWPSIASWTNDPKYPYQATPIRWNPFDQMNQTTVFHVIGHEECPNNVVQYCDGPLEPSKRYAIRIRGFTDNGYNDTVPIYFSTDTEVEIGILVVVIIVLVILGSCISFVLYLRNGEPTLWSKTVCACKKETVMPPAIPLRNFPEHCLMMKTNENQLSSEFSLLETLSEDIALPTYTADLPHNRVKNRYPNIKPYDVNRVKLRVVPDEFSDYINASYIKGYNSDIEYIATQGPKEETVDDFWQMVYENEVKQIVMVTQLTEKGKSKCYKYYPEEFEPITCNNGIELECEFVELKHSFTMRHIVLKKVNQEKKVIHIQFHEWPDFGVPPTTDSLLRLCREIRTLQSQSYGVILVHCSAGVGRTGTVIAVDILVQSIHANRKLDVFGTVFSLRKQRIRMVKTQGQYAYIYNCLNDEILNPRVYQISERTSTYLSYQNREYPPNIYDNITDIRKMSTESAM